MKKNKHLVPVLVGLAAVAEVGCEKSSPVVKEPTATAKSAEPKPLPTVLKPADVHRDIPLGGAPRPLPPRPPSEAPMPAKAPRAPAGNGAAAADAPSPAAAPAPAPAPAAPPGFIEVAHNHPPGEACKPLSDEEIKRAFGDLKR